MSPSHEQRLKGVGIFLMFLGTIGGLLDVFNLAIATTRSNARNNSTNYPSNAPVEISLSESKIVIDGALKGIYTALNQGDPPAAASLLSPQIRQNAQELDFICRPFLYRAHYIESIAARPGSRFVTRVRLLSKPLDERAHTMVFHMTSGEAVLEEVAETGEDWFGPQEAEATRIVRKFVYAIKAGKNDVAKALVSPHFPFMQCAEDEDIAKHLKNIEEVRTDGKVEEYSGLKIVVGVSFTMFGQTYLFDLEKFGDELKIVRAFYAKYRAMEHISNSYEDPDLETYTLQRFGLAGQTRSEINTPTPHDLGTVEKSDVRNPIEKANPDSKWQGIHGTDEDGVSSPTLISGIGPDVSSDALPVPFSGKVVADVIVGTDGNVIEVAAIRPKLVNDQLNQKLKESIEESLYSWKFKPGELAGKPIAVKMSLDVTVGQ